MIRSMYFTEDLQTVLTAVLSKFFPEPDYLISLDWISSEKVRSGKQFQIMLYDMTKTGEVLSQGMDIGKDQAGNTIKGSEIEYTFTLELRCTADCQITISDDFENPDLNRAGAEVPRVIDLLNNIFNPQQFPSLLESTEGQLTLMIGETTYTDKTIRELGISRIELGEFRSAPVTDSAMFYRSLSEIKIIAYRSQKAFVTYN